MFCLFYFYCFIFCAKANHSSGAYEAKIENQWRASGLCESNLCSCIEQIEDKCLVNICHNGALDKFKLLPITKSCATFSNLSIYVQEMNPLFVMAVSQSTLMLTCKVGKWTAIVALADFPLRRQGAKETENKL